MTYYLNLDTKKIQELSKIKVQHDPEDTKKAKSKAVKKSNIDKFLSKRFSGAKNLTKKTERASVAIPNPETIALKDKNRFFKEQWEEDRRQLFFT